jgi:DNA-directed RNA polymerase specialized sigma24 family protein
VLNFDFDCPFLPALPTREIVGGSHWLPIDNPRVALEAHNAIEAHKDTAQPHYTPADYARVNLAVATLPEPMERAVRLRFWQDLSWSKMEATMNVPSTSVRRLVDKAITTLRAAM